MYYNDPNRTNCGNIPGNYPPDESAFDMCRCPGAGGNAPRDCNCCCNRGPTGPQGPKAFLESPVRLALQAQPVPTE